MSVIRAPGGLLTLSLLIFVACQQNATRDLPVHTRAPGGESTAPPAAAVAERGSALVRAAHTIPASATLDIYADENRVFDGLAFRTVTPYREVAGERFEFALRPAGLTQGDPLASQREGLDTGEHYTIFVLPGDQAAARLRVVPDRHTLPAEGQARVRVVQASADAGPIDVYAEGRNVAIFSNVAFQAVSDYVEIAPLAGSLEIRPAGDPAAMLTVPSISFAAGRTYTVVVVGRIRTERTLETFVIEDWVGPQPATR